MTTLDDAIARECQHPSGTMDDPLTAALMQCQCGDDFWTRRLDPADERPEDRRPVQPPGFWRRAWLELRAAVLAWNVDSTEQYMAACERDGILEGETLAAWRRQLGADRVALAVIEAQLEGKPAAWPTLLSGALATFGLCGLALLTLPTP